MARKTETRKSPTAFRTIGEAAEELGVPQHVLRFWETRFPDLQPLKRGGGRRYYRPADMALLEAIRAMLYDQGLTIRGAQQLLATRKPGRNAPLPMLDPPALPALPAEQAAPVPMAPAAAAISEPAPPVEDRTERARLQAMRDRLSAALAA
jgi:DNA-binding transcriptional MerR regulator